MLDQVMVHIDGLLGKSKYNRVDLSQLFGFMAPPVQAVAPPVQAAN
jgi:hypothetical protein